MAKYKMTRGKYEGLLACADEHGVIAAAAMDQRGSLQKSIAKARGDDAEATATDLTMFKKGVVKVLTPHASAVLIDPEYGLEGLLEKAPTTGVLLAYEKTGYDATLKGRLPDLLPDWSVRRLFEAGANAIKILLYYNPLDEKGINEIKHALGQNARLTMYRSFWNPFAMMTIWIAKAWNLPSANQTWSPDIWKNFRNLNMVLIS